MVRASADATRRGPRSKNAPSTSRSPWKIAQPVRAGPRIVSCTAVIVSSTRRVTSSMSRSARSTCAVAIAVARAASSDDAAATLATIGRIVSSSRPSRSPTRRTCAGRHHDGGHLTDGHRQHGDRDDAEENVGHASGPTSRVAAWNCSRARSNAVVSVLALRLTISRPCSRGFGGPVASFLAHADSDTRASPRPWPARTAAPPPRRRPHRPRTRTARLRLQFPADSTSSSLRVRTDSL